MYFRLARSDVGLDASLMQLPALCVDYLRLTMHAKPGRVLGSVAGCKASWCTHVSLCTVAAYQLLLLLPDR
jgi:hypothetical protein